MPATRSAPLPLPFRLALVLLAIGAPAAALDGDMTATPTPSADAPPPVTGGAAEKHRAQEASSPKQPPTSRTLTSSTCGSTGSAG